ncbi:peptidoglycan DD-metalloendopeptidase family protein [Maribius pontilimi]|uniref:Peptidoglycan DD-metalloendopeptidase family protein n=1 Tax=Palleronia pontilimi TaxID=1964209 RepID=A0A934I716_9RHOB|nr:peptidoglycan DD-metalloendopeptidase family protein [Palleronia pontilimi]MBJ3761634.1 peptidoglycan DD-metalloendopeptidase family protein [Palleronia pontilimi]
MIRLLCLLCVLSVPAHAQTDASRLADRAARALDEAAQGLRGAESSRDRVAALTRTVQAYEEGLAALREGLRRAAEDEARIAARLDAERAQLAQLLGTLQTMGSTPEALFLLHPSGPVDTARAGMLIRDVTPAVLSRVQALRADLSELARLRALQSTARADLAQALQGIQKARAQLSESVSDRVDLPDRLAEDEDRMSELARSVDTLYAFAARLPKGETGVQTDFASAKGALDLPVAGNLALGFDRPDAADIRRPGWLIETDPGALVVAPWPATVRYVGPLLDYGNVMILEPGPGYLMVLAGLGVVYARTGEIVGADDPLGLMPVDDTANSSGIESRGGSDAGQTGRETLYVELREGNAPVDPAIWFAAAQE